MSKWYTGGVRFSCLRCGNCCKNHDEYEYVCLGEKDVTRVARHLHLSDRAFLRQYCKIEDYLVSLSSRDDACPFLEEGGCRIYEVRPTQCATWPFWRENLDKEVWNDPIAEVCKGIGRGELRSCQEIEFAILERDRWYATLQERAFFAFRHRKG